MEELYREILERVMEETNFHIKKSNDLESYYENKKHLCTKTTISIVDHAKKDLNVNILTLYLSKGYHFKILTDEVMQYLVAFYLEKCFFKNHCYRKYLELFDLQVIFNLITSGNINVLNCYTSYVKKFLESIYCTWPATLTVEAQLNTFLGVLKKIPTESVIFSYELAAETVTQYENVAYLLKVCCDIKLANSRIVVSLLKVVLKMHARRTDSNILTGHVEYPPDFLKYILHHCNEERFNLGRYLSKYPDTIWGYSERLSILDCAARGEVDNVFNLMVNGAEVYPEHELKRNGYLSEFIPWPHQIILDVMKKIVNENKDEIGELCITSAQKKCFGMIWEEIAIPDVTSKELYNSIKKEIVHLESQNSNFLEMNRFFCEKRKRDHKRLANLFKSEFCVTTEMEPCSLQKLCRIQLRKSFMKALRNADMEKTCIKEELSAYSRLESNLFKPLFKDYINPQSAS